MIDKKKFIISFLPLYNLFLKVFQVIREIRRVISKISFNFFLNFKKDSGKPGLSMSSYQICGVYKGFYERSGEAKLCPKSGKR